MQDEPLVVEDLDSQRIEGSGGVKASLSTLIRLQTWRCEDERRALNAARTAITTLNARQRCLSETLVRERQAATALLGHTVIDTSAFERRMAGEREAIDAEWAKAETALATARDALGAALAERRKLELAEASRQRAVLREQNRHDLAALDEIALRRHALKGKFGGD